MAGIYYDKGTIQHRCNDHEMPVCPFCVAQAAVEKAEARRQAFEDAAEMCRKKAEEWLDESFSIHDAMREFALELEARAKGE